MKLNKRKIIRTAVSIIDTLSIGNCPIIILWIIALASLAMAIYQEATK
jgi:hypothetical protein